MFGHMPNAGRAYRGSGLRNSRATALGLTVLLFLAGLVDLIAGHGCPHHDALPVSRADEAVHPAGHAGAPDNGAAPADAPQHGPCTCVDSCPAGIGEPLPVAADARPVPLAERGSVPGPRDPGRLPTRLVPYLLPYAHAPPPIG
jgi:hypothetical protein